MTKFQKQMLTIAAAGALTAVTALPAMAFENEFHGAYWFNSIYSNASKSATTTSAASAFLSTTDKANSVLEQRVRLQYSAKASDDLKLVTQFEINNRFGKKNATANTTGTDLVGSDIDTDGTNIFTKHAYLDFNVVKGTKVQLGLMPYKDAIGGILLDADLPAVSVATKFGGVNVLAGFARTGDNNVTATTRLGDQTQDFTFIDLSYAVNKATKVGASYYLFADDASTGLTGKRTVNTFALNGQTSINGVNIKGFVALQDGEEGTTDYKGYAYNLQATTALAGGNAKLGYLYVSGDTDNGTKNTQFQPVQAAATSTFNDSGMMLMIRNNKFTTTSTNFMKSDAISNVALAYAGYNKPLSDKLSLDLNVGLGWDNTDIGGATTGVNGDFIGTEVNAELAYKLYKELTVAAQVGYISLGSQYDAYKDPYAVRLAVTYSF